MAGMLVGAPRGSSPCPPPRALRFPGAENPPAMGLGGTGVDYALCCKKEKAVSPALEKGAAEMSGRLRESGGLSSPIPRLSQRQLPAPQHPVGPRCPGGDGGAQPQPGRFGSRPGVGAPPPSLPPAGTTGNSLTKHFFTGKASVCGDQSCLWERAGF